MDVKRDNIHSAELLKKEYGIRPIEFYSGILAQIIAMGKPGKILDLGAGLGLFTELAHTWGINVVGLEGSDYGVEESKKRRPCLKMLVHDLGDDLPFEDETASNILLNQVVEHIDPKRCDRLMSECFRVLEPGGRLFVYSPSKRNTKEQNEPTHINLLLPSVLKGLLENSGFRVIDQPNSGFWFFHRYYRITNFLSVQLLKIVPHDWLSGTANAVATKIPGN